MKTAGPTLRGAAGSRTLQEEQMCVGVGGEPIKNRGSHTARSGREPHTPGGTKCVLGLAVSPGKPRVPHCEERPGAAHSRRDQMYLWVGGEPGKPRVPYCEERPGAAHSRRDQLWVGVGGEPGKTAPTHPPSAGVSFGRAAVRDASAIPCRGALGVRAERGVGTLRRYHPERYLAGSKASTACQFGFFRSSLLFFITALVEMAVVQTLEGRRHTSRTLKVSVVIRVGHLTMQHKTQTQGTHTRHKHKAQAHAHAQHNAQAHTQHHGPRLYVCQAPKALIRVSGPCPPLTPNALIRVSPNAFIRVSPNAFTESATELASLAYLCSLRSHVFLIG